MCAASRFQTEARRARASSTPYNRQTRSASELDFAFVVLFVVHCRLSVDDGEGKPIVIAHTRSSYVKHHHYIICSVFVIGVRFCELSKSISKNEQREGAAGSSLCL